MRFRKHLRRFMIISLILGGLAFSALVLPRVYSAIRAVGMVYPADAVPARPVAVIFGAQVLASGRPSAMLADRVRMGAELYQAGKVRALLLTGDNSEVNYNEPEAMRRYALSLGVPDEAIVLDYAGFRTYDSCYRARDIFQVDAAILVTQRFHLDRALMICNTLGIDSIGVAADVLRPQGYSRRALLSSQIREFPSTTLSLFDLIRGDLPTFLGDPLPIFADAGCAEGCGANVWRIW
ncbi:MAG: YdcF family protein [Chloroflexi bacterium]|nr:YdcF family protein [Chloroflexota bacterium]